MAITVGGGGGRGIGRIELVPLLRGTKPPGQGLWARIRELLAFHRRTIASMDDEEPPAKLELETFTAIRATLEIVIASGSRVRLAGFCLCATTSPPLFSGTRLIKTGILI